MWAGGSLVGVDQWRAAYMMPACYCAQYVCDDVMMICTIGSLLIWVSLSPPGVRFVFARTATMPNLEKLSVGLGRACWL